MRTEQRFGAFLEALEERAKVGEAVALGVDLPNNRMDVLVHE